MEISQQPGCYVWNPGLALGATVTWTGPCAGSLAQGTGTLTWMWNGNRQTATGRRQDGMNAGHWIIRYADGGVSEGPFVNGEGNGHWIIREADGTVSEGPFVDGERNGHWIIRQADGTVGEGPYVNGERHGNHVIRWASGNVEERRYVNGEWVR